MAKSRTGAVKTDPTASYKDDEGRAVGNRILLATPRSEWLRIYPSLEFVRLKLHQVLHEAGEILRSVYFMNEGLGSVLTVQPDGKSVEVGLIGREGFVGVPVIFGFKTSALRVVTQADGTAYRIDVPTLLDLLPECPVLEKKIQRFSMILGMQSTQIAACNRLHEVSERLARWLMMSHDRIGTDTMPLTQEFLGQMLGTRRSSVSLAAGALQKAGLIKYTRGSVTVVDQRQLREVACDCYDIIQRQETTWRAETR